MIEKIISGGQTGADFAGLVAAKDEGIATGGTAPKGWRICLPDGSDGTNPELADFGLVEHTSSDYPPRTKQNVKDSDGTVWIGYTGSGGAKLTLSTAEKLGKHSIVNPSEMELARWIIQNQIKVLNVAGNRESDFNPEIYDLTYNTISQAIQIVKASFAS